MKNIKSIIRSIVTSNDLIYFAISSNSETALIHKESMLITFFLDFLKSALKVENSTKVASVRNVFRRIAPANTGLYFTITTKSEKELYLFIPEITLSNKDIKNLLSWAGYEVRRNSFEKDFLELYKDGEPAECNDSANLDQYAENTALPMFLMAAFYPMDEDMDEGSKSSWRPY